MKSLTKIQGNLIYGLKIRFAELVDKFLTCFPGMETILENIGGVLIESTSQKYKSNLHSRN